MSVLLVGRAETWERMNIFIYIYTGTLKLKFKYIHKAYSENISEMYITFINPQSAINWIHIDFAILHFQRFCFFWGLLLLVVRSSLRCRAIWDERSFCLCYLIGSVWTFATHHHIRFGVSCFSTGGQWLIPACIAFVFFHSFLPQPT